MNRTAPGEMFLVHPEAVAQHYKCNWAGADIYRVWEHVESYKSGCPPDYICCLRCEEMVDNRTGEIIT